MNPEEIRQLIRQEIGSNASQNQFQLSPIAAHTHNGIDSLRVDANNLVNNFIVVPWTVVGTSAATATNYSAFFIAPWIMTLNSVQEIHTTAGTDVGAVSLQIEKLTGTTAPGSGTTLLSSAFNLKGTANTLQTGTLTLSKALNLAVGDRLALKLTGTPTSVANVTIVYVLTF